MNIGQAICERVGIPAVRKYPNSVAQWLYGRLGNGDPWDGRAVARIVNDILSPVALGDIEWIITQLALAYLADLDGRPCPEPPKKKRASRANPRSRGKPAGRRRSRRK